MKQSSYLGTRIERLFGDKLGKDVSGDPRFRNTPEDEAECGAEMAFRMRRTAAIRSNSEALAAAKSGTY